MDDLKKFSEAVLRGMSAAKSQPGVAGISDSVNAGFQTAARAPMFQGGSAVGGAAGGVARREEEAAEAARRARMAEIQDMLDPSKYRRERKEDGGFAFYDPSGNEIDINTYAQRVGIKRVDAIRDSENPLDLQFMNDYSNMESIMKRAFDGDDVSSILKENNLNPSMRVEDLNEQLIRRYPHIFGVGTYEQSRRSLNNPVFKMPSGGGGMFPGFDTSSWITG